jgi:hypothetical protein
MSIMKHVSWWEMFTKADEILSEPSLERVGNVEIPRLASKRNKFAGLLRVAT